ncbi:SGNH/GDSL hydrolase family protein [Ornithinibacillus halophilus]|uniref:Lysophospholipase L1 n=1 Tax=Ornithinibacillus halophilus TaxID=930117 RepID=A0A1M5JGU2_9BACI|nr:SGNH/GDSL hydrolase family protein [Ornithinibacillus halophilus]SHG39615.1 Lysophospholipase L1 [Ornithinibacillus halophilus]
MLKKGLIGFIIILIGIGITLFIVASKSEQGISKPGLTVANEDVVEEQQVEDTEEVNDSTSNDNESEIEKESELGHILTEGIHKVFEVFQNNEYHISAIGDSLTQGVGDETENGGFVGILESQLNHDNQQVTFDNFGKRGNRTDQLLTRLKEPDIIDSIKKADIVIFTIGANDIMQVAKENFTNLTYEVFAKEQINYEDRLRQIIETTRDLNSNAEIYLIGFYNPFIEYFPEVKELDQIVTEWNRTAKLIIEQDTEGTFIPTKDLFQNSEVRLLADDHFHPNYSGYQRIAERVLDYVTEPQSE